MSASSNTTVNGTQPTSSFSNPLAVKIGKTFAYCLIFIVSFAGNTLIGIIVYKTKTMRKTINFLIVNMAVSDLLLPIFLFPQVVTELYVDSWLIGGPLGQALCKLHVFVSDASVAVSIQSLVLITVDRFGAVVFPLNPPLVSSRLCRFFIPATWIIAMAVQSPYLFVFRLVEHSGKLVCTREWNEIFGGSSSYANYLLVIFTIFLYTPLLFITLFYCIIILKLKSRPIPGENSLNAAQQRMKRERNVLKMAIAIVLGFAVCWVPYTFSVLLGSLRVMIITQFVARANCAINPCICVIFSRNYRQNLKKLLYF